MQHLSQLVRPRSVRCCIWSLVARFRSIVGISNNGNPSRGAVFGSGWGGGDSQFRSCAHLAQLVPKYIFHRFFALSLCAFCNIHSIETNAKVWRDRLAEITPGSKTSPEDWQIAQQHGWWIGSRCRNRTIRCKHVLTGWLLAWPMEILIGLICWLKWDFHGNAQGKTAWQFSFL